MAIFSLPSQGWGGGRGTILKPCRETRNSCMNVSLFSKNCLAAVFVYLAGVGEGDGDHLGFFVQLKNKRHEQCV